MAVQPRCLSLLPGPHFVTHRIINHTDDDLALKSKRDRDTKVRDAVKIILRSIERIDHPLMLGYRLAHNSFFAVKGMMRELVQKQSGDEFLCSDINLELDVVRPGHIHPER